MEERLREHLKLLGCTSPLQIFLACQVFTELVDVKLKHNVQLLYSDKLKMPYLTAKNSKSSAPHIFIPCSTADPINMKFIEKAQDELCDNQSEKSITVACVEGDSTIVFYTFSNHLVSLNNPEIFTRQKSREERKNCLENEIRKKRRRLLDEALKHSVLNELRVETIDSD